MHIPANRQPRLKQFFQWLDAIGATVTEEGPTRDLDQPEMEAIVKFDRARPFRLLLCIRTSVYPRDVAQLENSLALRRELRGKAAYFMVLADFVSDGARQALRNAGIGYFDASESAFLSHQTAIIFHERPALKKQTANEGRLFGGKSGHVLHALLQPKFINGPIAVHELADFANVSPSLASTVLQRIEQRGWAQAEGKGPAKIRRLTDPGGLLDTWVLALRPQNADRNERFFIPRMRPEAIAEQFLASDRSDHRCHISFEFAGNMYAAHLTSVPTLRIRVLQESLEKLRRRVLKELNGVPTSEGWNLELIPSVDQQDFIFDRSIGERMLPFANPVRVYLDLMHTGGRARELAEHLRKMHLRY